MFYKHEKLAIFVDGRALSLTCKGLNIDMDFSRLLNFFKQRGHLLRSVYFTPIEDTEEHVNLKPLVDWLQYNGWTVATKPLKCTEDADGRTTFRGNTRMELAVAALRLQPSVDHFVLIANHREFTALIKGLQEGGSRVTVVSSMHAGPASVADDLRRQADAFLDLETMRQDVSREARQIA